jgi:hypothetical protein
MALTVWVPLMMVGGSLASKIGSVQNNDPQTWLRGRTTRGTGLV